MKDALLTFSDPNHVPSRLLEPAACDVSVLTLNGGWPEDLEPLGDVLEPTAEILADPAVGMTGVWGLLSADLRSFEEATGGEVDALQAYWLGFRRSDVRSELLFDPKFTFYRNADIDFSLRWRAAGYRLVAAPLPLERHTHREWEALDDHERERKSRDNFSRVLRRWRDRTDLLTGRSRAQ